MYQSGVTLGGTIVAFETIPFKEIRAIWRFKSVKKTPVKEAIYSLVSPQRTFMESSAVSWTMKIFADAEILKKMVVKACVNIEVPELLKQLVG